MAIAKCGHAGCTCLPNPESTFCNSHCQMVQEKGAPEEVGCGCGHIGCDPRSITGDIKTEDSIVAELAPPVETVGG